MLQHSAHASDAWRDLHARVESGDYVSLASVLDWLDTHYVGQVIEVELERDDVIPLYEVDMVGPQGQVVEFEFDARSGELLKMEGARINEMRRP